MENARAGEAALRGLVPTLKPLSGSGSIDRQRVLFGKHLRLHWLTKRLQARLSCAVSQGCGGTPHPVATRFPARRSPRLLARPLGSADPSRGRRARCCHFCRAGRRQAVSLVPLPRPPRPAPASPHPRPGSRLPAPGPLPSPSPGAQRCSPIVRSPEPGLLGAPSRGTRAGQGAWEPLTAVSRRSLPSRRRRCRRLPPWLQRRHLTTEVTHRPRLPNGPQPRPLPVSTAHSSGIGRHLDEGRKPSGKRPEPD